MIVSPGDDLETEAYVATRSSDAGSGHFGVSGVMLRGSASSLWTTWAHTISHNLGLSHNGGYETLEGRYHEYEDDATMGHARERPLTYAEIGARYGHSPQWVEKVEARALKKLKGKQMLRNLLSTRDLSADGYD